MWKNSKLTVVHSMVIFILLGLVVGDGVNAGLCNNANGPLGGDHDPFCSGFLRGDVNDDGVHDITDAVIVLGKLFGGDAEPFLCSDAADANDDGILNVADPLYILSFLFISGEPFPPPYPTRGGDPTEDDLACEGYGVSFGNDGR